MKILYASDVHSGFENLKKYRDLAIEINPDLTVVSGDLIDFGFETNEEMAEHMHLLEPMVKITEAELKRTRKLHVVSSPAELFNAAPIIARKVLESPIHPPEWKKISEMYLDNIDKAICFMEMQYKLIRDLFTSFKDKVLFIPGNYDPDLEYTSLKENNFHQKTIEVNGFKIAGYGGAGTPEGMPIGSMAVPLELAVAFNEVIHKEGAMSKPYTFLAEVKPDIALVHMPPFDYLDSMEEEEGKKRHIGSPGIHKAATEGNIELIVCGHNHEGVGAVRVRRQDRFTAVINAGSLRKEEGGRFFEIELDDPTKRFLSATQYGMLPLGGILVEARYLRADDNSLHQLMVNALRQG